MKKVVIGIAAVVMAVCANAATVTWQTCGEVLNPDGTAATGDGYVTMYMFVIDQTAYTTLTADGDAAVSANVWSTYGSNLAGATDKYVDDGMGQFGLIDSTEYGVGQTAYAAIIMAYDEGDGITHYKGNVGSATFEADVPLTISDMDTTVFGDTGTSTTAVTWQAVPEPTSGLLFLIGMAGLALRRRRA